MKDRTIKICLMIFNITCLFVGLGSVIVGILLYSMPNIQNALQAMEVTVSSHQLAHLSILMMAIGGLIVFISFVGCCGAMNESKCMIGIYSLSLSLLFLGQLAIGVLGFVYGNQITQFEDRFKRLMEEQSPVVASIEKTFECCGYNGPDDYVPGITGNGTAEATTIITAPATEAPTNATHNSTTAPTMATSPPQTSTIQESTVGTQSLTINATSSPAAMVTLPSDEVPTSKVSQGCCKAMSNESCPGFDPRKYEQYIYTDGCKEKVQDFIARYEIIIGAVSVAFALIELMAIIAACSLYKSLD